MNKDDVTGVETSNKVHAALDINDDCTEVVIKIHSTEWIDPMQLALVLNRMIGEVLGNAMGVHQIAAINSNPGPHQSGEKLGEA